MLFLVRENLVYNEQAEVALVMSVPNLIGPLQVSVLSKQE